MRLQTLEQQSGMGKTRVKVFDVPVTRQCYFPKDLAKLARFHQRLVRLESGDNQNACCCGDGRVSEFSDSRDSFMYGDIPLQLQATPTGGIDSRTRIRRDAEDPEARKIRLTSGPLCKSLLDDTVPEPMPPELRKPGCEPQQRQREKPRPAKTKDDNGSLARRRIGRDCRFQEKLEHNLRHLPFFRIKRYNREQALHQLTRLKPLRGMLRYGRYYIEKDWKSKLDPRTDPEMLAQLQKLDDRRRNRQRADGTTNRIVGLFMEKVVNWSPSREIVSKSSIMQSSTLVLLWLGPSLAKRMLNELCVAPPPSRIFEEEHSDDPPKDFFMINRLSVDIFFSDKEAFYYMMKDFMLSPSLTCKAHASESSFGKDGPACEELEAKGLVTTRACVHQNLSLSLKPCLVPNCPNYMQPVCRHLYAFIPETITINSYSSMLHFVERFQRVEDLKGCIFITKPAYLCNGRGINFLVDKQQFEYFYHMLDGKATSRHGVVVQRYIECPRLFDRQKFTIRFFLLIIVLTNRRVVAFIHYGLAIFSLMPYESLRRQEFPPEEEALEGKTPNLEVPIAKRSIGRVVNPNFSRMSHLSNYYNPDWREAIKKKIRNGTAVMLRKDEDNAFYLDDILPSKCRNSTSIYVQMLYAAQCMLDYMQPIIQDYPGTFQTVSIDSLVDARNKLWILEAGTNIFSGLLTIAPRQRHMMSAIMQESLGLTIECFYKNHKGLPLYWNYHKKCQDYSAFCFAQDFNLFYETDVSKQTGDNTACRRRSPSARRPKRLEERYREVDALRDLAKARKQENMQRKIEAVQRRMEYLALVKQKHEEES